MDVSCQIDYRRWHQCSYISFVTCFVVVEILKFLLPLTRIWYVKRIVSDIKLQHI
jgi:hypothetical protein